MAAEPITLFSRFADPAAVARRLRELVETVQLDGPDDGWQHAVITFWQEHGRMFRKTRKKLSLTFTHNPESYAEPNWSQQMAGLRGYFARFPDTEGKTKALTLTTSLHFALGTLFEPECDVEGDPRINILCEVAELLDGVLFTPTALRDARGRILFGAGDEEDPAAVWPRVIGEVSLADPVGTAAHEAARPESPDEQDAAAPPPNAQRVARRALALTAVTVRAILEQESASSAAARTQQDLLTWVEEAGLGQELEPDEWEVVQRPVGRLDERQQIDSTWRLEGLVVLAWALGRCEIPPHDRLVRPNPLWRCLGYLDAAAAATLLADPSLRSSEELAVLQSRLFALHWRLRNFHLNGKVLDFADFARTCWFGPLDITGLPLVKGDLALGRKRLDRASPDALSRALSAAQERHLAANWLCEGPECYSDARTDT